MRWCFTFPSMRTTPSKMCTFVKQSSSRNFLYTSESVSQSACITSK